MDNRDYEKALDKCWNKFCESKPTLSKQPGVLTLFNFIFDYLYPIEKHNLTSDAEEEEMLTCAKSKVMKLYNKFQKDGTLTCLYAAGVLDTLFGSKCLPDNVDSSTPNVESLEPQTSRCEKCGAPNSSICAHMNCQDYEPQSEPKYHKGDKACYNGYVYEVEGLVGKNRYALKGLNFDLHEDMIDPYEPYTEPDKESRNHRQNIANCDKHFDNILKGSFSKERRLNIAVQLTCAMIPKYQDNGDGHGLSVLNEKDMIKCAYRLADMLIAEAEKGDTK